MSVRVTAVGEATSLHDRKVRAGQRLWIGFPHPYVDDDLRRLVAELRPSGFTLFGRNVEEPAQVRELCRELRSLVHQHDPHRPALISIDQEGGRVQRVRAPATVWPPMRVVGQAGDMTRDVAVAMGKELRAMELDLDFAPVADVDSNPDNPVIGDRSFGRTAAEVGRHVVAFTEGLQSTGIIACAKHFPGHGDTHLDSHVALPTVEEEASRLLEREVAPFADAVRAGVGTVMTSHVIYPAWDEELPATLSPHIVPRQLRDRLGYGGVVVSDDLEMKAVAGRWDVPTQARLTAEAGVDVLLACKTVDLQVALFEALVALQEDDPGMDRILEDSTVRLARLRERFLLARPPAPELEVVGCSEHQALAALAAARGA